jgi:hypothetical protein
VCVCVRVRVRVQEREGVAYVQLLCMS